MYYDMNSKSFEGFPTDDEPMTLDCKLRTLTANKQFKRDGQRNAAPLTKLMCSYLSNALLCILSLDSRNCEIIIEK